MSRAVIGTAAAVIIALLTGTAYMVTTSSLESGIHKDIKTRVAKAQELLIQNSSLEMLRILKRTEALAMKPGLALALSPAEGAGPDPVKAEEIFQGFRADLKKEEAQPDIMAMTDDTGRLVALLSGSTPVTSPVPDSYLKNGKIKYPALASAIKNQFATSEIWDYEGSGAMKVTVAPILDPEVRSTLGTVIVAYAISSAEAKKQQTLLGAHVAYFYGDAIHATSLGSAKEQQATLGKILFGDDGLAKQALTSKKGHGDIKVVTHGGEEYLATTGRLPRYSSKDVNETPFMAGAMVLISLSKAKESIGMVGMSLLLVGFLSIVMVLIAIQLTAKNILHPLEEIEIGVNEIINGNLDRTFEPVGSDLDGMANALNVMLARLLGRPEPGEEEFDEDGNIIRADIQLPMRNPTGQHMALDAKQADAVALAAEPTESYLRRVHSEFVAAQTANGESGDVSYDDFVAKLHKNEGPLKQKYGAREVRFKVVTEDGKVTLKPVPIM